MKKKNASPPQEEKMNENEGSSNITVTSVLLNPLSSLEAIRKAQMEQIQRRCLLNYLSLKQRYEIWRSNQMYHEQLKAQVLSDTHKNRTTPNSSRLHDTKTLDFSSLTLSPKQNCYTQQQQQLLKRFSLNQTMLSKNPPIPVLPSIMPSISENDDLRREESEPKMQSISKMPTVSSKMAIPESDKLSIVLIPKNKDLKQELEPKLQSISKMPTASSNMALKPEDDKISILVAAANQMPLSGKDDEKSTLPPKKRIKRRLSDDETNDPDSPSVINRNRASAA